MNTINKVIDYVFLVDSGYISVHSYVENITNATVKYEVIILHLYILLNSH